MDVSVHDKNTPTRFLGSKKTFFSHRLDSTNAVEWNNNLVKIIHVLVTIIHLTKIRAVIKVL